MNQPAHPCRLIRIFVVLYNDSVISMLALAEVSRLNQAAETEHVGFCLTRSEIPKTGFLVTGLIFHI